MKIEEAKNLEYCTPVTLKGKHGYSFNRIPYPDLDMVSIGSEELGCDIIVPAEEVFLDCPESRNDNATDTGANTSVGSFSGMKTFLDPPSNPVYVICYPKEREYFLDADGALWRVLRKTKKTGLFCRSEKGDIRWLPFAKYRTAHFNPDCFIPDTLPEPTEQKNNAKPGDYIKVTSVLRPKLLGRIFKVGFFSGHIEDDGKSYDLLPVDYVVMNNYFPPKQPQPTAAKKTHRKAWVVWPNDVIAQARDFLHLKMLELYGKNMFVSFHKKNNNWVNVYLYHDVDDDYPKGFRHTAYAHTAPEDTFDLTIGRVVALCNVQGIDVPDFIVNGASDGTEDNDAKVKTSPASEVDDDEIIDI